MTVIPYTVLRHGLPNFISGIRRRQEMTVAFLGGSITEMTGWRNLVCDGLQARFPEIKFRFVGAGIGSMGSIPHAFRLERDVLAHGPVDLLFLEAAVNDSGNGYPDLQQRRAMEGIVRHVWKAKPDTDIVSLHFVDPDKMEQLRKGVMPQVIVNHEVVMDQYGIPSINLAQEVTERIDSGEFTWDMFRDLHPSPFGHEIYAAAILRLLDAVLAEAGGRVSNDGRRSIPTRPLDPFCYERGCLVEAGKARYDDGWHVDACWNPGQCNLWTGFGNVPMLVGARPGATLELAFEGTAVGILVTAGPASGVVEFRTDGNAFRSQSLFTKWSPQCHLPWAFVLEDELAPGRHELELRISEQAGSDGGGTTAVIRDFLVNGALVERV